MILGRDWMAHPHQSVPRLIEDCDRFYEQLVIPTLGQDAHQIAADRILKHRKWSPAEPLIAKHLETVVRELGVRWVPKQLDMGPALLFPRYDTTGMPARATLRPVGWELAFGGEPVKYAQLGSRYVFRGPAWIGNTDPALTAMMVKRLAILVEGPFDVLACRLMRPDLPTLTSGTKTINSMHFAYLRVLGVDRLAFLFDNDRVKSGNAGAGQMAAEAKVRWAKKEGFKAELLRCPAQDPSACLELLQTARQLRALLEYAEES